jgi:hypothetical protein
MSKKIFIPISIALLVAILAGLWVSTEAFAQEGGFLARFRRARPVVGQVTAISGDRFTIEKRDGKELTFTVDDNTRFTDKDKARLSFDDLEIGLWVSVAAPRGNQDEPAARLVVLLPENLDPSQMTGFRGSIIEVDASGNQFTLQTQQGEKVSFDVDSTTVYKGEATAFSGLQEGLFAGVAAKELENGCFLAQVVRTGFPVNRLIGEILTVDQKANTFTLRTMHSKEEMEFKVDENTQFRSKAQSLESLEDLELGMVAVVVAKDRNEALPLAIIVGAADKENLPKFDLRVGGRIVSLEKNSFTIKDRNGQEHTFQVTGDTLFRSRGGRISGLDDLKEGMPVIVGANELENGDYQAELIIAMPGLSGQSLQPEQPGEQY